MAKKKRDVSISLESIHSEFERVNTYDLIDKMFDMQSTVYPDKVDKVVPPELIERIETTGVNGDILNVDEWLSDYEGASGGNIMVAVDKRIYDEKKPAMRFCFGFVRGGKSFTNPLPDVVLNDRTIFEFCTFCVFNPLTPRRIFGRNTFNNDDYEKVLTIFYKYMKLSKDCSKVIGDRNLKLKEYNLGVLNLCRNRIDGIYVGTKEPLVLT